MRSRKFVSCALVSQPEGDVLSNCRIAEVKEWKRDRERVCVCLFAYIRPEDPSFE